MFSVSQFFTAKVMICILVTGRRKLLLYQMNSPIVCERVVISYTSCSLRSLAYTQTLFSFLFEN